VLEAFVAEAAIPI
jgi:predicted RNA binding protein YcfA (HicA-like mRNA interferase family)